MDNLTVLQRSRTMSRIRSKDTLPECRLRKSLHKHGFRYRKNVATLPGKPDIVLPKYKTVIFVNGCFWHQHANCSKANTPKSNKEYWDKKLIQNVERDKNNFEKLKILGWKVLTVWECELQKDLQNIMFYIKLKLEEGQE